MVEPQYQELLKKDIPHVSKDGVHVAVIAGISYGASVSSVQCVCLLLYNLSLPSPSSLQSPVRTRTPTMYLDFRLDPGAHMTQPVTEGSDTHCSVYTLAATVPLLSVLLTTVCALLLISHLCPVLRLEWVYLYPEWYRRVWWQQQLDREHCTPHTCTGAW